METRSQKKRKEAPKPRPKPKAKKDRQHAKDKQPTVNQSRPMEAKCAPQAQRCSRTTSTRTNDLKGKGNTLYGLFQTAYGRVEKISFLHRALACYDQASGLAKTELSDDDLVQMKRALAKNKALVYRNVALLEERESAKRECFFRAAELFTESFHWASQMTSDKAWITPMEGHVQKLCEDFKLYKENLNCPEKILRDTEVFMQKLSGTIGRENEVLALFLAREWLELGQVRVERAMELLREEDYKKALINLKELYCPLEETKKLVPTNKHNILQGDIRVLEGECHSQTFIAEALQALKYGKVSLKEAIKLKSDNKIDEAHKTGWDALDKLKEAKTLAKDQDVEVLCQILLNVGKVFLSVFGLKYKAKGYISEVIDLTTTLSGNLYTRKWYADAANIASRLKQEEVSAEEAKWENIRQPYLQELAKEMAKIWKIQLNDLAEVHGVLKDEFIPKHQEAEFKKLGECPEERTKKKKFLAKLITLYHPDRVDKNKHGLKYYVLCEEITKMLTNKYNAVKEML